MALSIGDATQAATLFQQAARDATNDGDIQRAVQGFTTQISDAAGGSPLTGGDLNTLQNSFEALGLKQSDFAQSAGLSQAFQSLTQVPAFSALGALQAFQHAEAGISFNVLDQPAPLDAPPPPPPDGLEAIANLAQGPLDPNRALSDPELQELTDMRAFGHEDFGGVEDDDLFGEDVPRLLDCACFSWALSGASAALVDPSPIFGMLGNNGLMTSVADHIQDVKDAPTQEWLAQAENKQAIEGIKDDIIDLEVDSDEAIERVTKLLIEANGMEVVDDSDFAICMEYTVSNTEGVNFTHWGIQFMDQTLETNPGVGFWKTDNTFANNWTADNGSTKVVSIPVREFTPTHNAVIRDVLAYNPDS